MKSTGAPSIRFDIPGIESPVEIGRGARGIVYRAQRAGQTVAVKVALDALADVREARLWFAREGAILACINHPGLAEIVEVGEVEGRPYLVREYVAGRTVAADLVEGPLAQDHLVTVARILAAALAQVHRYGLVHRDVKPHNIILLDDKPGAKLIDFGLATRFDGQARPEVAGTFLYSAPEQSGMLKRPVDGRADLYALGVVIFESACGQLPFSGDEVGEVIRAHAVVKPPDLRQLNPALSPVLCMIVDKLLSKDPDDRYQTGDGLAADLERLSALEAALERGDLCLGAYDQEAPSAFEPRWAGREDDLGRLLELWNQVLGGQPGMAVIEGEPGSGKSRLVREVFRRIAPYSPVVIGARCSPSDPPMRAIRDAVEAYLSEVERLPRDQAREAVLRIRMAGGELAPLVGRLSPRLAAVFGDASPPPDLEDSSDPFYQAMAEWILRLADAHSAAVFYLDDLQWIDEGSREVVRRVVARMGPQPLLLLGCTRNDEESLVASRSILGESNRRLLRVVLAPLGEEAVGQLLESHLGGRRIDPSLARLLTVRTRGNPFFVGEYLRAMLEAGLLRPHGPEWRFSEGGMERLPLASDVLNLVLERLRELTAEARQVLELAAAWGQRFELSALAQLGPQDGDAAALIGQACELRLLERSDQGHYVFVHDRIREALLAGLPPLGLRELHRHIGEYLDARPCQEIELIYARAHHLFLGRAASDRVYQANLEAGRVAMESFAPEQAYQFLGQAGSGPGKAPDFKELQARVCMATNRLEEAAEHLDRALEHTSDPLQRARLWEQLSMLHLCQYHISEATYKAQRGFREIGRPPRRFAPLQKLATAGRLGLFILLDARVPNPEISSQERERLKIITRLLEHMAYVQWFGHDLEHMADLGGQVLIHAWRLGRCRELVRAYAKVSYYAGILGREALVERFVRKGEALARELADPIALAHISLFHGLSLHQLGYARKAETMLARQLEDQSRWLDALDYSLACTGLISSLMIRGHTREGLRWVERALQRQQVTARQNPIEKLNFHCYWACLASFQGRPLEAAQHMEVVRREVPEPERIRDLASNLYSFAMQMHLEQGELGARLEEAIARYRSLRMRPDRMPVNRRHGFLFQAYARLAQIQHGQGSLRQLGEALKDLRQAATLPYLECHLGVIEAAWLRLHDRSDKGMARLAQAEMVAGEVDSPWAMFEIALERARVLLGLGNRGLAARQAQLAHVIALEQGWEARARRIQGQFMLTLPTSAKAGRSTGSRRSRESGPLGRPERHLDALVQVSLAAGAVLNPNRQARVCLDEMIRLLGAERGFLFLNPSNEGLEVMCARDSSGQDLSQPDGYSQTVIQQVRAKGQPLVVSGTEQGELLGSESVVAQDIRSILAAPLIIRGRLIGIVYLENRLARGVFTEDDVGITVALCNHVAIALENARAAALEASLQAERRQRDLAESVRDLATALGSTLQFNEVLGQLLERLEKTVPFSLARALAPDGEGFAMLVQRGDEAQASPLPAALLHDLVRAPRALHVVDIWRDDRFDSQAAPTRAWLAVPLVSRGEVAVVLVLEHPTPGQYSESLAELALTFAAQAGVALENARLFAQVQKMATTDELTGLNNRRHFFELARAEFAKSQRHSHPLAAMMLDVDRFKSVNDTHGHAAGDQVLRQVAQVCRETLRTEDILGRYGGEEFAVLLPSTGLEQAQQVLGERLRRAIEACSIQLPDTTLQVTASLGVAGLDEDTADLAQLLNRADAALYAAKNAGRNRVIAG